MKILAFSLLCLPFFVYGTSTLEEGLILQEELRFLEEVSQKSFEVSTLGEIDRVNNRDNDLDLESTYFGQVEDEVSSRTSAPRRRTP